MKFIKKSANVVDLRMKFEGVPIQKFVKLPELLDRPSRSCGIEQWKKRMFADRNRFFGQYLTKVSPARRYTERKCCFCIGFQIIFDLVLKIQEI